MVYFIATCFLKKTGIQITSKEVVINIGKSIFLRHHTLPLNIMLKTKTTTKKLQTHQHKPVQQTSDLLQASCLMPESNLIKVPEQSKSK